MVPEVVVFMTIGILIGPHGPLPVMTDAVSKKLNVVTNLTLGAVMFIIGERLLFTDLRRYGKRIFYLLFGQVLVTSLLVGFAVKTVGASPSLSVVLAIIATETGALTVAAVCSKERLGAEKKADFLMSAVGVTNVVTAFIFGLAYPLLLAATGRVTGFSHILLVFFKIMAASFVVGIIAGILLVVVAKYFESSGELLVIQVITLLAVVGISSWIGSSVVISMLTAGLVAVNMAPDTAKRLFSSLKPMEPIIYLIFFLIAGAGFDPRLLSSAGEIGGVYIAARIVGKVVGALFGALTPDTSLKQAWKYGTAMLPHAGLAVGLLAFMLQNTPGLGTKSATIVLASIILFETIGPIFTRRLLKADSGISFSELRLGSQRVQSEGGADVLLLLEYSSYNVYHLKKLFLTVGQFSNYLQVGVVSKFDVGTTPLQNDSRDHLLGKEISVLVEELNLNADFTLLPALDLLGGKVSCFQKARFDIIILCGPSHKNRFKHMKAALDRYMNKDDSSLILYYDLPSFVRFD